MLSFAVLVPTAAPALEVLATDDTFIHGVRSDDSFGDSSLMKVSRWADRTAYISFDLSSVIGDVESATIALRVADVEERGTLSVHLPQGAWRESSLTADTSPSLNPNAITTLEIRERDQKSVMAVDISGVMKAWLDDPSSNFGLALVALKGEFDFDSTEGERGPTLNLVITGASQPTPTNPTNAGGHMVLPVNADSFTKGNRA